MSRDIDIPERNPQPQTLDRRPERTRLDEPGLKLSREHKSIVGRSYAYSLSEAELETMQDIGRFRTIATSDLASHRYQGNRDEMRQDLHWLARQGLVRERTAWTSAGTNRLEVVVLTKAGKELLEREGLSKPAQHVYAGFVKPAEVAHDAAIYRMYQAEAEQIEQAGGRIRRVVLDYELKQKVYSPLVGPAKTPLDTVEFLESPAPPPNVTLALLERGQDRYRIYCAPCHSELGDGRGMIVQRGFPSPPSYHSDRLRQAPVQHLSLIHISEPTRPY